MSTKPRKVSTGFKTASTPDFKTAKAAMTDAPPVTDQPEDKTTADDHVDCTQILNEEAAYEGPTQLNEDEEEEETPAVPRQTPSGTAGPPPPRPRFSYTSQSSTPPAPATAEATSAPDALRDVRLKMGGPTALAELPGGEHTVPMAKGLKQLGLTQARVTAVAVDAILRFIDDNA